MILGTFFSLNMHEYACICMHNVYAVLYSLCRFKRVHQCNHLVVKVLLLLHDGSGLITIV